MALQITITETDGIGSVDIRESTTEESSSEEGTNEATPELEGSIPAPVEFRGGELTSPEERHGDESSEEPLQGGGPEVANAIPAPSEFGPDGPA